MALATLITAVHLNLRTKELIVQLTPSGNYSGNGTTGDVVNLATAKGAFGSESAFFGYPGVIKDFEVLQAPAGYAGILTIGATLATWGLRVYQTGAALSGPFAELANAAYPAGVLAGVFQLRFRGPKLRL